MPHLARLQLALTPSVAAATLGCFGLVRNRSVRTTRLLAGALLLLGAQAAWADWHLVVHAASWHHTDRQIDQWNAANVGLGLREKLQPGPDAQWGAYRNSLYKNTAYGVLDWTPATWGTLQAGGFVGVVAGGYHRPFMGAGGLVARF